MQDILFQFGLTGPIEIIPFGSGLINSTWKIADRAQNKIFILQQLNHGIFKEPHAIALNIRLIAEHLEAAYPDYLFAAPCTTTTGAELLQTADGYYRMFPFVPHSHTVNVVEEPQQAYEAAAQFGRFTKYLSGLDPAALQITLPDFHNLPLRYRQFEEALVTGNRQRVTEAADWIAQVKAHKNILHEYESIKPGLVSRVTHHDTKISNVLFDEQDKGLCVIDLDTVMPGYFTSDVGDMMRTYLSPVSEEEQDFTKIMIRPDFYAAIVNGYLSEMGELLNETEKQHIHFAGEFMIYMQAIRFLTDHLNNDSYYGATYPGHNLVRAGNQLTLLEKFRQFNPA